MMVCVESGDVDFGLGGDGRWQINWDFIDRLQHGTLSRLQPPPPPHHASKPAVKPSHLLTARRDGNR